MKENLFEAYARMCKSYSRCKMGCPMYEMLPGPGNRAYCQICLVNKSKEVEEIITKWAKEHPIPIKTRQDAFLQLFPKALMDEDGILTVRPCFANKKMYYTCKKNKVYGYKDKPECEICRKKFWKTEV